MILILIWNELLSDFHDFQSYKSKFSRGAKKKKGEGEREQEEEQEQKELEEKIFFCLMHFSAL